VRATALYPTWSQSTIDGGGPSWIPDPNFRGPNRAPVPESRLGPISGTPIFVESVTGAQFVLVASRVCMCGARSYSGTCPHCSRRLT
jgi:hypothetical protein